MVHFLVFEPAVPSFGLLIVCDVLVQSRVVGEEILMFLYDTVRMRSMDKEGKRTRGL